MSDERRERIEAILSPAIDVRAPYARQMVQALLDLLASSSLQGIRQQTEDQDLTRGGTQAVSDRLQSSASTLGGRFVYACAGGEVMSESERIKEANAQSRQKCAKCGEERQSHASVQGVFGALWICQKVIFIPEASGVDGGASGDAHEESKPANQKDDPSSVAIASQGSRAPQEVCDRSQTPPDRAIGMTCTRPKDHDGPCAMDGVRLSDEVLLELWRSVSGPHAGLTGPLIRFAGKIQALWLKKREAPLRLAREAVNSWACYARSKREHDDIARLHKAIDAIAASPSAGRQEEEMIIRVPRPVFVLGDPKEKGSSFRVIYGPEDENGGREIVGSVDQQSPHFDLFWDALAAQKETNNGTNH